MSSNNALPDANGPPKKQTSPATTTPTKLSSLDHSNNPKSRTPKPSSVKKSKKEDLSAQFNRLNVSNGSGKFSLNQLLERDNTPSAEDVTVTTAQREKAVATKKYLSRKYAERRRTLELSKHRRKAFEVCQTVEPIVLLATQ